MTGHSLGDALATLCAGRYGNVQSVSSFVNIFLVYVRDEDYYQFLPQELGKTTQDGCTGHADHRRSFWEVFSLQ